MSDDIDNRFDPEPLPPAPRPGDPPATWKPVSALQGEMRSYEHLDKRLDLLAGEIRDGFRALGEQLGDLIKTYGRRIERLEQRQDDHETRLRALETLETRRINRRK